MKNVQGIIKIAGAISIVLLSISVLVFSVKYNPASASPQLNSVPSCVPIGYDIYMQKGVERLRIIGCDLQKYGSKRAAILLDIKLSEIK